MAMVISLWAVASLWDMGNNRWDGIRQDQLVNTTCLQTTNDPKPQPKETILFYLQKMGLCVAPTETKCRQRKILRKDWKKFGKKKYLC